MLDRTGLDMLCFHAPPSPPPPPPLLNMNCVNGFMKKANSRLFGVITPSNILR